MRICFTVDTMNCGGAERVVATLANEMLANNNEVTIVMISTDKADSFYLLSPKVNLIALMSIKKAKYFGKVKLLSKLIDELNPDVVVSFLSHVSIYSYLACKKSKKKIIVSERSNPFAYKPVYKMLLKYVYKKANGCVFQTEGAMSFYGEKVKSKSVVILNPVDNAFAMVPKTRKQDQENKLIYVGRLVPEKNPLLLIDSFSLFLEKNPDYILNIYGDGCLKNEVQSKIELLNLENKAFLHNNDNKWYLKENNSKMFLLTSNYEGMPNSLLEALCLGIRSVSTDCQPGGPREISKLTNLLTLVECNNPQKFCDGMIESLSNNYTEDEQLFYNNVSVQTISTKWIDFIKKIVEE